MKAIVAAMLSGLGICLSSAAFAGDLEKLPSPPGVPELYVSIDRAQSAQPAPTALFLHVSGGMTRAQLASHKQWSEWLRQQGVAFVSLQRGRTPPPQRFGGDMAAYIAQVRERASDARRGLDWLASTGWADPQRLLIIGQSLGGTVGIVGAVDGLLGVPQVALYPACDSQLAPPGRLERFPRSLWILGEYDPVTPAKTCIAMREAFLRAGAPAIEVVTQAKAYHEFDFPTLETRDHGGGPKMLFSIEARDRARGDVATFLKALGYLR